MPEIIALYQAKDRKLLGESTMWIDPLKPLPKSIEFFPTDKASDQSSHVLFAVLAGMALLAVPGMLYLGTTGFALTSLVLALFFGALTFWGHRRYQNRQRRRSLQMQTGHWRFGHFWSRDSALIRDSKDWCFSIPRKSIERIYSAEENISVNEKNQYLSISVNVAYRLESGQQVGLQLTSQKARLISESECAAARALVGRQVELFSTWRESGDLSAVRQAYLPIS